MDNWTCDIDIMEQAQIFTIVFLGINSSSKKNASSYRADQKALELEFDTTTAKMLYWIFLSNLKRWLLQGNTSLKKVARMLGHDVKSVEMMYVMRMILISSLNGTSNPTESDIFKLVSLLRLNQNSAIINNNVAIALDIWHHKILERFCSMSMIPDTGPIMVQLRHTLKRDAHYIWNAFVQQVCPFCLWRWLWIFLSTRLLITPQSYRHPVVVLMRSRSWLKGGYEQVVPHNLIYPRRIVLSYNLMPVNITKLSSLLRVAIAS